MAKIEIKNGNDLLFYISRKMGEKQYELAQGMLESVKNELEDANANVEVVASNATTKGGIIIAAVPEESRVRIEKLMDTKLRKWKIRFGKSGPGAMSIGKAIKEV